MNGQMPSLWLQKLLAMLDETACLTKLAKSILLLGLYLHVAQAKAFGSCQNIKHSRRCFEQAQLEALLCLCMHLAGS